MSNHIVDDHTSNNEVQVDLDTVQTCVTKWQVIFNSLKATSMLVSLRSNDGNGHNFTFQKHVINEVNTHVWVLRGIVMLYGEVI